MDRQGFLLRVDMVKQMAVKVLQQREREEELYTWSNVILSTLGMH